MAVKSGLPQGKLVDSIKISRFQKKQKDEQRSGESPSLNIRLQEEMAKTCYEEVRSDSCASERVEKLKAPQARGAKDFLKYLMIGLMLVAAAFATQGLLIL